MGCCKAVKCKDNSGSRIILVGQPNVGKSLLFNRLTHSYNAVSNYPGTTVALDRGKSRIGDKEFSIVDTPGVYSLIPMTDEECVTRDVLLEEKADIVIHVIDAKNVERMLFLTLELIEAGLPVIVALNMMDEARKAGVEIDEKALEGHLGVPVVKTIASTGEGIDDLKGRIGSYHKASHSLHIRYDAPIEKAIDDVSSSFEDKCFSPRIAAICSLSGDTRYNVSSGRQAAVIHDFRLKRTLVHKQVIDRMLKDSLAEKEGQDMGFKDRLSQVMMNPITGFPILALILYFGLYLFVGVLGAGIMVDFIETIFDSSFNPFFDQMLSSIGPHWVRELLGGEYGIVTFGVKYAIAIILPIVSTFFIAFSVMEDTGYLPRLAMLIDRAFKKIGLNGRAVIPLVLGFGCDTMATMVTRTQETRKEKIITTLLLALAIPCSAQLGVVFAILAGHPMALGVWAGAVLGIFLVVGFLASKAIKGDRPYFYMELPPLRMPSFGNIAVKTLSRLEWYFKEIIPFFILASLLIWAGRMTGAFDWLIAAMAPLMGWMGLPSKAAEVFIFGFFRRDYGAAGLYAMKEAFTFVQLTVSAITLTLFVPCIAQFSIMLKERGWKTALGMVLFIVPLAFAVGIAMNYVLTLAGAVL